MSIQLSTAVRNARLNAIETAMGTGAIVKIKTGSAPANCAAADSGTVLATFTLSSDYMSDAASGSKAFSNTPVTVNASATGSAAHYRVYASDGTTCHMQGTVAESGGDMTIANVSVNSGQEIKISSWTITDANS